MGGYTKWDFEKVKTAWANTDSRLGGNAFFKEDIDQQIAIGELGGCGDLKDFLEYLETASGGSMTKDIIEQKGLMRR